MPMFNGQDLQGAAAPPPPDQPIDNSGDMVCPTCGASAAKILAGGQAPPEPDADDSGM